ncbi:MAG TPA: tartrate dehydrogenase [Vicinamibacterales bacterium]|jgi:tartrate dehydrogenase/decarboxylase/D-malate dehydrogenase|nr:tartrate dehydrogenase [Vicinamibacterales bacterium]
MKTYRIAVIAGDGIGKEVIPAGISVLNMAAEQADFRCDFTHLPWGCDYYLQTGRMIDDNGVAFVSKFDAIYLGAIGDPRVPDHISARDLILPLRQQLRQYVNLRPMRLLSGITSPLANKGTADIDMICVRENSEGEYCGTGGRVHVGTPSELAVQTGVFTRTGIERIVRYAFKVAESRPRKMLASATKSNALQHAMVLWDEVAAEVAKEFPHVEMRKYHVDALCARMVTHPQTLDTIVASNLFGDILTDIGSAISGSLGVAPGGNINPDRTAPSMFEPIHGSAPDIAGKGIANPIASIWAGAMMLDHLGEHDAYKRILRAIEAVISDDRVRTPDLGGKATTEDMTRAVTSALTQRTKQPA